MTIFSDIYRDNRWNGAESRSGPGSGTAPTERVAQELMALVAELDIHSVLDVGCGDGFWMPDLPGYVGIDGSSEAIKLAKRRHPDRLYVNFDICWFLDRMDHGGFDLVIVRDAIQHLSLADGEAVIETIRRQSGARWLLASTFVEGENIDIETGYAYSPDLTVAPFSLWQPERLIFDGYGYEDPDAVRDPRKHLGLWHLR